MTDAACGVAVTRSTPIWSARSTWIVAPAAVTSWRIAARFSASLPPTWNEPSAAVVPSSTTRWPVAASVADVVVGRASTSPSARAAASVAARSVNRGRGGWAAAIVEWRIGNREPPAVGGKRGAHTRTEGLWGGTRHATETDASVGDRAPGCVLYKPNARRAVGVRSEEGFAAHPRLGGPRAYRRRPD